MQTGGAGILSIFIHSSKARQELVTRSFALKYSQAGCYEGQNLCRACRNHVYKNYGTSSKENVDANIPPEDPPNTTVQNADIREVTDSYNYQQLKSINDQINGLPASEIIATTDKKILNEVSFLQIEFVKLMNDPII